MKASSICRWATHLREPFENGTARLGDVASRGHAATWHEERYIHRAMNELDPMKTTKEERSLALRTILWSLTVVKNCTTDQAKIGAVDRAERALRSLSADLLSDAWPPSS
jgi:hypothetical protein